MYSMWDRQDGQNKREGFTQKPFLGCVRQVYPVVYSRCCGADMKQTSAFYSPSLLFLSQSVLCPDHSMCVRVAHELCHTWFGLITGPLDWTEEWLTEGFCTYSEDILHAQVCEVWIRQTVYFINFFY